MVAVPAGTWASRATAMSADVAVACGAAGGAPLPPHPARAATEARAPNTPRLVRVATTASALPLQLPREARFYAAHPGPGGGGGRGLSPRTPPAGRRGAQRPDVGVLHALATAMASGRWS